MAILRREPPHGGVVPGVWRISIFDQYLALSRKWRKIEPQLLWNANRKPHPSFRMVPVWMTLSDLDPDFKVTFQRQMTKKVQNRAIFTMADQYKVVYGLSNGAIFNDLERPLLPISRSCHYLMLNISKTLRDRHSFNGILIGTYTRTLPASRHRSSMSSAFRLGIVTDCPPYAAVNRRWPFPVAAPRIWNSLPQHVTSAPSLAIFHSRLKTHIFFRRCCPRLHLCGMARWLSGRASDLRSRSRGFEARPRRCCATTLGKLFTPYCLCHKAV